MAAILATRKGERRPVKPRVEIKAFKRDCWSRIHRGILGAGNENHHFMVLRRGISKAGKATALHEEAPLDEAESAGVAARLADMRRTVGAEDFAAFIEKARAELHTLSQNRDPWSDELVARGLSTAMLLGFASLEAACRDIIESPNAMNPGRAPRAAQAAIAALESAR